MKKRSPRDTKQEAKKVMQQITVFKEETEDRGIKFACATEEEIVTKLRGDPAVLPYIAAHTWDWYAEPGATVRYKCWIYNPDDGQNYNSLYLSLFFGPANFLDDIGEGLIGRDKRWPYLTIGWFRLNVGQYSTKEFTYTTPDVPRSTYLGNTLLWHCKTFGKGTYLDRSAFYIKIPDGWVP